jgi:hypothetical protein
MHTVFYSPAKMRSTGAYDCSTSKSRPFIAKASEHTLYVLGEDGHPFFLPLKKSHFRRRRLQNKRLLLQIAHHRGVRHGLFTGS